ncbi:hypothetical protein [Luteimonas vadosa]|uniref:Uncharacterized protein n=1 Tax=Luteimonas vadosa TaxID=1165507 RepID=A0ABP9E173_9GAMM
MKVSLNGKFGEAIGYLAVLVPLLAFLLYIEVLSWLGLGAMAAASLAVGGGFVALSGLFAHGVNVVRLRGRPAAVFWGGCIATALGVVTLLWLDAHDTLVIGGFGLALVCVLLAFGRSRRAGDA